MQLRGFPLTLKMQTLQNRAFTGRTTREKGTTI